MSRTVEGVARNAKAGAVCVEQGGCVWYLDDMDAWPDHADGKRVRIVAEGTSVVEHDEPLVNARGEHSAGMQGTQTVLRNVKWVLLE